MMQSPLFKSFFVTLLFVGCLEIIAIIFHLFLTISWFDMVMHFFGGFLVGMFILWVLTWVVHQNLSYGQLLLWGVSGALIVGVCWEFFELYNSLTYLHSLEYIGDTGMDIVMDVFGGLVAVIYSYYILKK